MRDELTKNTLIVDLLDAVPNPDWKNSDEDVEVKEEREPSGRLMLRDGCNDGNVNLGVASVPKRVEATTPGCDDSCISQSNDGDKNRTRGYAAGNEEKMTKFGFTQKSL